jgi:dolichol kinase
MGNPNLETERNLFHLAMGLLIVLLIYFGLIDVWVMLWITVAGFFVSLLHRRRTVPVIGWFLRRLEREDVMESFPGAGAFFSFVGMLLSLAIFPRDIALASIIIFVVGDSVSPLVGIRFGRMRHPMSKEKALEGSAAGLTAAFLGAVLFVAPHEAFMASLVAMAVEAVDYVKGRRIEDNITMPLFSGITIMALRAIF